MEWWKLGMTSMPVFIIVLHVVDYWWRRRRVGNVKLIYVNKIKVAHNAARGQDEPVITICENGKITQGHEVLFMTNPPVRLVYRRNEPLSSGAQVWLETVADLKVTTHGNPPTAAAQCPNADD